MIATHPISIVPRLALLDSGKVTWSEATKLYGCANRTAGEAVYYAIACGRVLRVLRDETTASGRGGGGDRKSAAYKAGEITSCNVARGDSFETALEAAGIPKRTAYDWIEQANQLDQLIAIRDGKQKTLHIEIETPDGIKEVDRPILDLDRKRATQQLSEIEAGRLWPKRAWAGFRSGLVTASAKRAPANVFHLIREAVASLDRQLPKRTTLTDDERLELKKLVVRTQIVARLAELEDLK